MGLKGGQSSPDDHGIVELLFLNDFSEDVFDGESYVKKGIGKKQISGNPQEVNTCEKYNVIFVFLGIDCMQCVSEVGCYNSKEENQPGPE